MVRVKSEILEREMKKLKEANINITLGEFKDCDRLIIGGVEDIRNLRIEGKTLQDLCKILKADGVAFESEVFYCDWCGQYHYFLDDELNENYGARLEATDEYICNDCYDKL